MKVKRIVCLAAVALAFAAMVKAQNGVSPKEAADALWSRLTAAVNQDADLEGVLDELSRQRDELVKGLACSLVAEAEGNMYAKLGVLAYRSGEYANVLPTTGTADAEALKAICPTQEDGFLETIHPMPDYPAIETMLTAQGYRCAFGDIGLDFAIDAIGLPVDPLVSSLVYAKGRSATWQPSYGDVTGTARLIGNSGATQLSVYGGARSMSFTEHIGGGSLAVTTVYPWFSGSVGALPGYFAVYSRHVDIVMPSQSFGVCRPVGMSDAGSAAWQRVDAMEKKR